MVRSTPPGVGPSCWPKVGIKGVVGNMGKNHSFLDFWRGYYTDKHVSGVDSESLVIFAQDASSDIFIWAFSRWNWPFEVSGQCPMLNMFLMWCGVSIVMLNAHFCCVCDMFSTEIVFLPAYYVLAVVLHLAFHAHSVLVFRIMSSLWVHCAFDCCLCAFEMLCCARMWFAARLHVAWCEAPLLGLDRSTDRRWESGGLSEIWTKIIVFWIFDVYIT